VGREPTSVFAGGQDGVIMRWTGADWRAMPTPTRETIVGLWGTSETNVFAVGSNGVILHYDGNRMDCHGRAARRPRCSRCGGLDATHVYATGARRRCCASTARSGRR
jgi:hypothetical protein